MADSDTDSHEDAPAADAQTYPPSDCGTPIDPDLLWIAAQADVLDIHHPEADKFGYVVLDGGKIGTAGTYDMLLVPRERITGIECDKILSSSPHALNVWKYAWQEAQNAFKKNPPDILIGINSLDGRTRNQLHIHLTALKRNIRTQIDKLSPNSLKDLNKWNDHIFKLGPGLKGKSYVYRIAHVDNLETNPFDLLEKYVSAPYQDRFAQSLAAVTCHSGGFYLLATQGPATQKGQPDHKPVLHIDDDWGTSTAEGLMDRNWK